MARHGRPILTGEDRISVPGALTVRLISWRLSLTLAEGRNCESNMCARAIGTRERHSGPFTAADR